MRKNAWFLFGLLLILLISGCAGEKTLEAWPDRTPTPGVVTVDTKINLGKISPFILGSNYGPWASVPFDFLEAAENSGITYIRFPGGNWGDQFDMTELQIDRFIDFCRMVGAEPQISVRVNGGSPEAAAKIVQYTLEKDYAVKYWSIGNEPELYDGYDAQRFNQEWRAIAEAMLEVDPDIILLGPEVTQFTGYPQGNPQDENGVYWINSFLEQNGDLVDIVSIHRYPFPMSMNAGQATKAELEQSAREWDTIIPDLHQLIVEVTGEDKPVAVTEFNSYWSSATGGETTPESHYSALWLGDVLGRMMQQKVEIAAQFALQSPPSYGGFGLIGRYDIRPAYYVYQIYTNFGETLLYADSGVEDVRAYAARREEDAALTLVMINFASEERTAPLDCNPAESCETAAWWLLDPEHQFEPMGEVGVGEEGFSLPSESMVLLVFENK